MYCVRIIKKQVYVCMYGGVVYVCRCACVCKNIFKIIIHSNSQRTLVCLRVCAWYFKLLSLSCCASSILCVRAFLSVSLHTSIPRSKKWYAWKIRFSHTRAHKFVLFLHAIIIGATLALAENICYNKVPDSTNIENVAYKINNHQMK